MYEPAITIEEIQELRRIDEIFNNTIEDLNKYEVDYEHEKTIV